MTDNLAEPVDYIVCIERGLRILPLISYTVVALGGEAPQGQYGWTGGTLTTLQRDRISMSVHKPCSSPKGLALLS